MPTAKETIDWYDNNADEFTAHIQDPAASPYHAYYEKPAIYAELPDLKTKSVISLGCGSGEDTQYLKSQGASKSIGIDISQKLIDIAKKNHPDCAFHVMDMEHLDFDSKSFDLVYSSLAMHYLQGGFTKAFREAFRVLKKGGTFLFSGGHPIVSSFTYLQDNEKTRDRRLGSTVNRENDTEQVFGDYLTARPIKNEQGILQVIIWHQPLSDTINQLIETGFILDKVIEPKPTEGFKDISPRHYERLSKIPEIVIFKAHKPAGI